MIVDAVDAQCFIVHSSLFEKYGLHFDRNLKFDLYCEDLSYDCKIRYNIKTRIVPLNCCHWWVMPKMQERHDYEDLIDYMDRKYPDHVFSWAAGMIGGKKPRKRTIGWAIQVPVSSP